MSAEVYRSRALFDLEIERIFRKTWKFVCHESELPAPGDFRAYEYCGLPILTIRSLDGTIRSFLNVCSHRSAPLVRERSGNASSLRCFFHLWGYDTYGNCTNVTRDVGYEELGPAKESLGLRAIRTSTDIGLIFINLDDDAAPLPDFLGSSIDCLRDCMGTKPLEVFHFHKVVLKANWKQWHETNMDGYHHWGHVINRMTNLKAEGAFDRKWLLCDNGHGTIDPARISYANVKGWADRTNVLPGLEPGELRAVDLFPNTAIIVRGSCVRIDTSSPIGPDATLLECRGLGIAGEPVQERAARIRDHNQYWGPFGRNLSEDIAFVQSVAESNRGAARYSLMSRREEMRAMDEGVLRHFYKEWSKLTGESASRPGGDR
ncbi:MAG TPA: aromatic ring-hydroxylating dioxygenase subunit alpha [Burkholderiaceae bacterium]|nr:aromatic ring-hydroxylating dioxygenase subunit alpha [Burkholderiaceae bacterium]